MRELTFEEHKQYQLGVLKDVARFCDENGLRYYLAFGTLIGAVRHKGFIPWDDDIDIQMPRPDYEKFISEYKSDYFEVISPYNERSKHTIVKVIDTRTIKIEKAVKYTKGEELGVDIDVFPLDGQPDDDVEFLSYYSKKRKLYKKFRFKISDYRQYSWKGKIAYLPGFILSKSITKNAILDKVNQIVNEFDYENSKYVGTTASLYESTKNRTLKEWYKDTIFMEFEGEKFKIPSGYHEILKKIYGDYMQLPPEEQRIAHHSNKIYLK